MPDRRLRAVRLAEAMKRCGIVRTKGIAFSRPCLLGTGIPIANLHGNFCGGDSIRDIARSYELKPHHVENAIRFMNLFPRCDFPSFWNEARTRDYQKYLQEIT